MFPAGILQPPFYHKHFPKALNYGGIGVVIGHEITHGFDDKGRQFDDLGNINQWWDHESSVNFKRRKQCIIGTVWRIAHRVAWVSCLNQSFIGRITQPLT